MQPPFHLAPLTTAQQLDEEAKLAQVKLAQYAKEEAAAARASVEAAQKAAEAAKRSAKWAFWTAVIMAASVIVDIGFRVYALVQPK